MNKRDKNMSSCANLVSSKAAKNLLFEKNTILICDQHFKGYLSNMALNVVELS